MYPLQNLRRDYAAAFLGYLTRRDEVGLRAAYELGRRAMSNPIGMLDLVQVHHDVLLEILQTADTTQELQDVGRAASAFLGEALASFQMTQHGYMERVSDISRDRFQTGRG
jgi:hypothetical protein